MELILKEDVYNLGRAGEIVKVRDGYGRNFLLPMKKAVLANIKNKKELEHHQKSIALKQSKLVKQASELKAKLDQFSITIAREAGEGEKLFGSVTAIDIAHALQEAGHVIDRRLVHLEAPIKTIGIHDVPVRLHHDVHVTIKVSVVRKE